MKVNLFNIEINEDELDLILAGLSNHHSHINDFFWFRKNSRDELTILEELIDKFECILNSIDENENENENEEED